MILSEQNLVARIEAERAKDPQTKYSKLAGLTAAVIVPDTVGERAYSGISASIVCGHVEGAGENDKLIVTLAFPIGESGYYILTENRHMGILMAANKEGGENYVAEEADIWLVYDEDNEEVSKRLAIIAKRGEFKVIEPTKEP